MTKTALITGGSGQDGSYLIELLKGKNYSVHAQSLQSSFPESEASPDAWHFGDLRDPDLLEQTLRLSCPDEIYNLAALSRPAASWDSPYETTQLNAIVPQQICEWIVRHRPSCRFFQASSSEVFGDSATPAQNEMTPLNPVSPYAIAKAYAQQMTTVYRHRFGLHASCGILFNHESPRRPLSFVSQKIAHAAAAISLGITETKERDSAGDPIVTNGKLRLGNIGVFRDFGFAGDYVEAMHRIVSSDEPGIYVVGTGQSYSVADFCKAAFLVVDLDWREFVTVDESLVRATDTRFTKADITKLTSKLGWRPSVGFTDLVRMMVESRLSILSKSAEGGCKHAGQ